jgi:hypothetical protein
MAGNILKIAGIAASAFTGNPMFATLGNAAGGALNDKDNKSAAKKAENNAMAQLDNDRKKAADEAEKKRKARLPVDTVLSNPQMAGTLG